MNRTNNIIKKLRICQLLLKSESKEILYRQYIGKLIVDAI